MNKQLQNYLNTKVMKHINDVRGAFDLCANVDEAREIIDSIPTKFGEFELGHIDSCGFTIYNDYEEYGCEQSDELYFDWYEAPDLLNNLTDSDRRQAEEDYLMFREAGHPYDPEDFSEFARDFDSEKYNISAVIQAFGIVCNG